MLNIFENPDFTAEIIKLAVDSNFYGKRLRDKKLEIIEAAHPHLVTDFGEQIPEACQIADWLDENKPEKQKAGSGRTVAQKPSADTIVQGYNDAPPLPVIVPELDRVIVFGVQSNTELNAKAFEALQDASRSLNAELLALPIYYNKKAFSAAVESENEHFHDLITPYLVLEDTALFSEDEVILRAEAAVLPTRKMPINNAATINKGELVTVVASPKQQLKTLIRSPSMPIREAWTTGAVTQLNYTRSSAGSEAQSDHVFGGLLIEKDPKTGIIYTTNLVYKNGEIVTLDNLGDHDQKAAVVLGDLHCEMKDYDMWRKTLNWLESLPPLECIAVHDILHFQVASHHGRNNGKHLYQMKEKTVFDDLYRVIEDLNSLAEIAPVMVVESNHNSALDNWLHDVGYNPKRDPRQAKVYYLLNYLVCDALDDPEQDGQIALKVAFENLNRFGEFPELSERVTFGSMKESYIVNGYDLSQHGHKGQNGSTGSTNMFGKWGVPMCSGHTHSPAIVGKAITVGVTAKLDQGYNAGGGSSWNQSHAIIMPNHSASIVPMRGLYL